jgi:hypothetical protein
MSFLRWFGKREAPPDAMPTNPSDMDVSDATLPMHPAVPPDKSRRRSERMQRRELLYGVVRESMTASGMLSATYKFKVLSLDSGGREYLIMMDVPHGYLAEPGRITDMEGRIARSAKERFGMLVTAVYWRVNDMITASPSVAHVPHAVPPMARHAGPLPTTAVVAPEGALAAEALAFKQGLATKSRTVSKAKQPDSAKTRRSATTAQPDFSDTEPFDSHSPLGTTQFGGLN